MIELRWVVSKRNDTEPVLQYRQEVPKVNDSTNDGYDYIGWSDWVTVSTVTDTA